MFTLESRWFVCQNSKLHESLVDSGHTLFEGRKTLYVQKTCHLSHCPNHISFVAVILVRPDRGS